jgi:hypothetical protein
LTAKQDENVVEVTRLGLFCHKDDTLDSL